MTFAAGSGVQNLNKEVVKKVSIYLPPMTEQKRIVETLSSFDEYIDDLAELIEKKKNIRDGALEDLVTGKTRLEGYSCKWSEQSLKSLSVLITKQLLQNQKKENIQNFFSTAQLLFAGNESEGLFYGTIRTPEKYYLKWKEDKKATDSLSAKIKTLQIKEVNRLRDGVISLCQSKIRLTPR